jgi:hypothetical protein
VPARPLHAPRPARTGGGGGGGAGGGGGVGVVCEGSAAAALPLKIEKGLTGVARGDARQM